MKRKLSPFLFRLRITALLTMFLCVQSYAGIYAQKRLNLSLRNTSLEHVINAIKEQCEYSFLYSVEDIEDIRIDIEFKNADIRTVLDNCLKKNRLNYEIQDKLIVIKKDRINPDNRIPQKGFKISGIVKDNKGETLTGVTVRIEGTNVGCATDSEGKYSIMVPSQDVSLNFSFIGMKSVTTEVADRKEINIVLEPDQQEIEEVVVTGYQVIDKRTLTSSIETIKAADLDKVGALTVDQMLEGKVPGLMITNLSSTPGAAAKVRVRSGATFTGSRAPLWVIDGVIYQDPVPLSADEINSFDQVNLIGNALTGLNPQDIESINILKDASATAIYGTKAANGVIVITTKRGTEGKSTINYSGSMNMMERPHYHNFNLMNSKERVDVSREIAQRNLSYPRDIFTWVGYEKALRDYRLGNIDYEGFKQQVNEAETMNTDWFDELYRLAINTTHNVNLTGGNEKMRYYFSVGYDYNEGTEKNVGLRRITARSNIDVNLRKSLLLSLGVSGSVQEAEYNHSSINLFNEAYYNSRTIPFRNPDGTPYYLEEVLMEEGGKINTVKYNIREEMDNSRKNIDNKDFNINAQLNWDILKGVKLMASASYRNTTNLQEEWITDNTHFIKTLRTYDKIEDMIQEWEKQYSEVPFGGLYSSGMTTQRSLRGQLQLNLSKIIADRHVFNLNLGYEANSNKYKGSTGWTAPGYNHEQGRGFITLPHISLNSVNGMENYGYTNMIKWLTGQSRYDIYPQITDRVENSLSTFGIFNYSFDNRYIFNFNIRSDGSNQFGQYKKYKFKPTWSVSGRWNLHNEHFMQKSDKVNELALRISYGFRGTPPAQTPYMIIKNYSYDSNLKENVADMANLPNANLSWEKTSTLNAGLNFAFFNGQLSGAFDFAYSHGKDLLLSRPVSLVNGTGTQTYNGGEKKDYSYELSLNGTVINTKDWGLRLSANATMSKEKVLAGFEAENKMLDINDYLDGSIYLTGFPVDAFYSYRFDGLDNQGLPKFKNLESNASNLYELMQNVLSYSGQRTPKVYGGFNAEIRYRRFTLRTSFSYKSGHHTRMLSLYNGKRGVPMPHMNMRSEFNNRWKKPGDEAWAVVPALSDNRMYIGTQATGNNGFYQIQDKKIIPPGASGYTLYDYSDLRVAKADYIRWQTLSLNYNLPEKMLKTLGMNSMRISAQVSNLAVWTFDKKLRGQDPEQVQNIGIPSLPTYTISLNFGF